MRIVDAGIESEVLVGREGELLSHYIGAITSEERSEGALSLRLGFVGVFQVVVLITVGTIMTVRSIGTKSFGIDVQKDILGQLSLPRHTSIATTLYEVLSWLVGDDIDNTCNSIGTIERTGCSVEHFNAFHTRHIDAVEVGIIRYVACESLSVDEDENVFIAQSVETKETAH